MTETVTKIIRAANGWLIRSLLAVVFFGLTGWVAYNTHAADKTEKKVAEVCQESARHDEAIKSLNSLALQNIEQHAEMLKVLRSMDVRLAEQGKVLKLIEDGKISIKR